jgi:tagaturonate epimerase
MDIKKLYVFLQNKFKNENLIYSNSFHLKEDKIFFLVKNRNNKFFGEICTEGNFLLNNPIKSLHFNDFRDYAFDVRFFECSIENSKKIMNFLEYLKPVKINQKASLGFGDRIGIASGAHVKLIKEYNFFPVFAQQSVREIVKTGKDCESVLHYAVMGVFQEGYKGVWGADADHITDKEWLKIMINNKYVPYTMYTIDTYDYVNTYEKINKIDLSTDKNFKERFKKAKKYIGKNLNLNGYSFNYTEDILFSIVKKYYKSLDFLKDCYEMIKFSNQEFDFEPAFDEKDMDTKPEDHFYIASELLSEGVDFNTLALKFPGKFEKGIDYDGNLDKFIKDLSVHKEIVNYFGCYKLSLHSADDKFMIFKPFRDILKEDFHIKTSGTTWMESLRTIAQLKPLLFREIFGATLSNAEKNSADYHISLDYKKIYKLSKGIDPEDLIDIKETRQLLHVSYGLIIDKFKNHIIEVLSKSEDLYYGNIIKNYRSQLNLIFK